MDENFWSYLSHLELLAFFSGYPLLYAVITFLLGKYTNELGNRKNFVKALPIAYALVGVLYLGLQIRNLYPDYSINNLSINLQPIFLKIWAILSILFFIPLFRKKTVISLLHSLIFFSLLVKDLYLYSFEPAEEIKNVMKIYTDSLLLNGAVFLIVMLVVYALIKLKKNNSPTT